MSAAAPIAQSTLQLNAATTHFIIFVQLVLAKQQAQAVSGSKRATPYPYVQSRINTGIPKPQTVQIDPRITKNLRVMGPAMQDSPKR